MSNKVKNALVATNARALLEVFATCPYPSAKDAFTKSILDYPGSRKPGESVTKAGKIKAMFQSTMQAMVEYDDEYHVTNWAGMSREARAYVFTSVRALSPALSESNRSEQDAKRARTKMVGRIFVADAASLMMAMNDLARNFLYHDADRDTVWLAFIYVALVTGCRNSELVRCGSRRYIPTRDDFVVFPDGTMWFYGSKVPHCPYVKVVLANPVYVSQMLDYLYENVGFLNANPLYLNEKKDGITNFKRILGNAFLLEFIEELNGHVFTPQMLRSLSASLFYRVHNCQAGSDQETSNRVCVSRYLGNCGSGKAMHKANLVSGTEGMVDRRRVLVHIDKMLCVCYICTGKCTCARPVADPTADVDWPDF